MKLHTVFITYNRLEYTKRAIESYLETVTVPYSITIIDNGSSDGTHWWVTAGEHDYVAYDENLYPGKATNHGWLRRPDDSSHLQRADNDFEFLPGWCDEVERMFENPRLGQLGLRTDEQEQHNERNVGGNNIIRRDLWDAGLRYDERSWPDLQRKYGNGMTEDSLLSPAVKHMGWEWDRVETLCLKSLAEEDPHDPYYLKSWEDRGLLDYALDKYGIER